MYSHCQMLVVECSACRKRPRACCSRICLTAVTDKACVELSQTVACRDEGDVRPKPRSLNLACQLRLMHCSACRKHPRVCCNRMRLTAATGKACEPACAGRCQTGVYGT